MYPRIETLRFALTSALPISLALGAHAASVTYDADLVSSGAQDGSGLGWNITDANLWNGTANVPWPDTIADDITFGAGSGTAGSVTVGTVNANKITFAAPGSGNYALSGGTITLGGTAPSIAVNVDANIASTLAGTVGVTTSGNGALTLTGAQTYNGAVTFANSSVVFSGSAASAATNNAILVGGASGRTAVEFNSTGNFTYGTSAGNARIGGNDGSGDLGAGAVSQTSGNVTFARNSTYLELATNTGASPTSYGSYQLSGGTLTTTVNGGMRVGNGGNGVFTQTGGTANIGRWLAIGASTGSAAFSNGVVTLTGGNLTVNGGYRTLLGDRQNASATLNIGTQAGGTATMTNANANGITLLNTNTALSATVNLNSGTLVLGGALQRNGTNAGSAASINLNGGTLRPSANNVTLISNANNQSANIYNGGLTVDTQSNNATISASLLAATGNGIYPAGGTLALPSPDGSGYIGAPVVTVTTSGAGTGASAVANITNGQVTGVTLTCPGQGYLVGDTVTFTFAGGGASVAALPFARILTAGDLAANGSGGLTKLGTGKLTMTGSNTFNGPLSITGSIVANDVNLSNTTLTIHNFSPDSPDAVLVTVNSLTTTGTVQVNIDGVFSPGSWPLIYYPAGGSIGGAGISAFQLNPASLPRGVVATLVDNPSTSTVDLDVTGFNPLTWKGNTNAVWDINTTTNWTIGVTAQKYLENDLVRFNDSATGSTAVTLNTVVAPQAVTFENDSKNYILSGSGAISGGASVTKTNEGTVTLLTNNTYTGSTTVDGGTLQLGNGTTNGSVAGDLINNASVVFRPAATGTCAASLGGNSSGIYTKAGTGTLIVTSAANTSAGAFHVNEGTLQFGDGTVNGAIGTAFYDIAAGATLRLEQATTTALPTQGFGGAGSIFLNSAQAINGTADWGTLALTDTYTGTLRVEKGRVNATAGSTALGNAAKIEILDGAQFLCFSSETPYTTPIEIAGNGWGENGYPGGLRLAGGATATWNGSVTLTAASCIMAQRNANFTVAGPITGAFQCEFYAGDPVADSGTLTVAPTVPGQNTYASTKINGRPNASIVAGSAQAFSPGPLVVDNAILKLNGHTLSFANLSGAGGAIGNYSTTTPVSLTVGSDNTSTTYAGVLRDGDVAPLALVKTGTGTLTLTAASSYTGNTAVTQGKLALTTPSLGNTSTVTIASGAVLELNTGAADIVGGLVLGGTTVGIGTYNASHPLYGSYFAGNGSVVIGGAFDSWAASKGLDGSPGKENGPTDDPEKDGIDNQTEFYLDGNPLASDRTILPKETLDATYITLVFQRRDDAEAEVTTEAILYGSNLGSWTTTAIGAETSTDANGVIITVTENDAAPDGVTVQIPRTLAANGKLFARLQVIK